MYSHKTDQLNELGRRNQRQRVLERMLAERRSERVAKLGVAGLLMPEKEQ